MSASLSHCHESKRRKRREAILGAAHALFVEKGFEATTLNDIVGRSGGSLATLYDLFDNKPGLLRAMVCERCVSIGGALDRAIATRRPYKEALRAIAEEMLDRFLDPTYIGLFRVVVAQCAAHSDLARQIYDAGPAVCLAKGAEYFETQMEAGTMADDDPIAVSTMFFQMVCGQFHTQLVFSLQGMLSAEERARHLDYVLPIFVKAFEPFPPRSGDDLEYRKG